MSAHLLADDVPGAVPLANEALALARQIGAPALIATGMLAVGATVAGTDPGQARACLRESRELSTELGYQSAIDLIWGTALAYVAGDQTGTLELGRRAIRGLERGDGFRMSFVLYVIAGALAATRPEAAAIIEGAAERYVPVVPNFAQVINLIVTDLWASGARELRAARGHGLGPGRRLQPRPDHPSPQRTRIRDPARSELTFQGADADASAWSCESDHGGHGLGSHPPDSIGRVVAIPGLSRTRQRPELDVLRC